MCILTYLSIHPGEFSDAQFVTIAQANPNLRSLYIISSNQEQTTTMLTSTALCEALSYLPKLELFFAHTSRRYPLPNALRLEDNDLYALARHCPLLTSVHISGHSNLSNDAIRALSKLPLLRKLHASECSNLLDSSLVAIAEGCPLLDDLNLSYCERISQIGINALALHSRNLISIELWRCPEVTNSAIQNLIRRARCLEILSIARNRQLTFAAVAELPIYCHFMRDVHLFTDEMHLARKPLTLEFYSVYRSNRRYFDIVFGWSDELHYAVNV
mmetsp:Transcript_38225/g.65966  ORF Transcript_38225/g.65966 Transcript_38225/m.65966 type:complete len:273 (+) Transcript_38225:535-1353(+)